MTKVFIDGREGTTGLRIIERLSGRAGIELIPIDEAKRKDPDARRAAILASDVTFLCLPDAAAKEAVSLAGEGGPIIIDASTAHRTSPGWAYGFPELSRAHRLGIANGGRIAVPGCHASGIVALIYPLVAAELLPSDYPIAAHSITGYSGGGKKMIADYQAADRAAEYSSPRQYALGQAHKHLPEVKAVCSLDYEPAFSPIVADFYSGMVVTVPIFARLLNGAPSLSAIRACLESHYAGAQLVKVLPSAEETPFLGANNLSGKDHMEIIVSGNDERMLLAARFDNLGKGASGAAIQCFNLATGHDEGYGLNF